MAAFLLLLPQIIAAIPPIENALVAAVNFIGHIRQAALQTAEWTDAEEAQFLDLCAKANMDPKYMTDKVFFSTFPIQPAAPAGGQAPPTPSPSSPSKP